MKIGRRRRSFSIILVPPGGGKPHSFSFGRKHMFAVLLGALILLAAIVLALVGLGRTSRFSATIARLKSENKRLREERQKVAKLEDELGRLRVIEGKLTTLLGAGNSEKDRKPTLSRAGMFSEGFTQERVSLGKSPTLWPVRGEISRGFSAGPGGHKGLDIAVPLGTAVRAAGSGLVEFAGEDEIFGNMVILNHGSGISTLYGHNSKLTVARGDVVTKGQIIAYSGNTGNSSAPHLHFETSRNGRQVDPLSLLSEQ